MISARGYHRRVVVNSLNITGRLEVIIEAEALKLALSKEKASIKLYEKLIAKHPSLKDILYSLLNEEMLHKKKIEDKIRELTRY